FLHGCSIIHGNLQPGNIVFAVLAADINNALSQTGTTVCNVKWRNEVKYDQSALRQLYIPELIINCSLINSQPGHKVMVAITDLGGGIFELICGEPLFCLSMFSLLTKQIDEEHRQMVEDIIKPALNQEAVISEFAAYLDMRTLGQLSHDVLPLARLLYHSMLVEPEHWKDAVELLSDLWFKDS
ncbi:serine protein kinase, putative, partial [Aspergillus lentulus]